MNNKTLLMGVLNITPDSFSDGGNYVEIDKATTRAKEMINQYVDIIDVGGESTRPGAQAVSDEEQIGRVVPVIRAIRSKVSMTIKISIDTNRAMVARAALEAGGTMVNALGGFAFDNKLVDVVRDYRCPIAIYHIKGIPQTMQRGEIVYKKIIEDITKFFNEQIEFGLQNGLEKKQFIIDPGIGFGKTIEQNIEIIKKIGDFSRLGLPIMIGVSRKSHLGTILQREMNLAETPDPLQRIEASLAETAVAVLNGASIVRTHDVLATKKFLTIIDQFGGDAPW